MSLTEVMIASAMLGIVIVATATFTMNNAKQQVNLRGNATKSAIISMIRKYASNPTALRYSYQFMRQSAPGPADGTFWHCLGQWGAAGFNSCHAKWIGNAWDPGPPANSIKDLWLTGLNPSSNGYSLVAGPPSVISWTCYGNPSVCAPVCYDSLGNTCKCANLAGGKADCQIMATTQYYTTCKTTSAGCKANAGDRADSVVVQYTIKWVQPASGSSSVARFEPIVGQEYTSPAQICDATGGNCP